MMCCSNDDDDDDDDGVVEVWMLVGSVAKNMLKRRFYAACLFFLVSVDVVEVFDVMRCLILAEAKHVGLGE
jgi:hypothetical protein